MKAGDRIRPKTFDGPHMEREVLFVGKQQVVYRTVEDDHEYTSSVGAMKRQFEVVPDCFEVGKTYSRFVRWSIRYQLRDVREHFHVTTVEENRSTTGTTHPVAIGYYYQESPHIRRDWGLAARYEWGSEGWKEDV